MSKCIKCKRTEDYNFAIDNGLCNPCIEGTLENTQADNVAKEVRISRLRAENIILDGRVKTRDDKIATLVTELQRYKQAPNIPFIKGGTCNKTHSACDCVLLRLTTLEAELEKHKWVSVEDELPEVPEYEWSEKRHVLTCHGHKQWGQAWIQKGVDGLVWTNSNREQIMSPTHWKPIVLPKESEQSNE